MHTGGAYRVGDEVWKPLDGRPFANADFHETTLEAEALEALQQLPAFPKNWETVYVNDRRWLVRPYSMIGGVHFDLDELSLEQVLLVECSVREANRRGWEINDLISVGIDPEGNLFIVDLSSANYLAAGTPFHNDIDEYMRIGTFLTACGYEDIAILRSNARSAIFDWRMLPIDEHTSNLLASYKQRTLYRYVYASFSRQVSRMWATLPEDVVLYHTDRADWERMIPWTWLFTKTPLPLETLSKYELKWGWAELR